MDEQTGTADELLFEASDMETVANESVEEQAPENNDSSAVEETTEQSENQEEVTEEPAVESTETTQTGDAIDEFLAKKGINTSDPGAIRKLAQMYQNSEKGFYSKSQEVAQLQRNLANQQRQVSIPERQAMDEVRALRIELEAKDWKAAHNLSDEDQAKMVEYLNQPQLDYLGNPVINPITGQPLTKGAMVVNRQLDLDDVYRLAGCGKQQEVDALKADLRKEVENEMAARQAAKRPSSNATNSTQFGKAQQDDPFLAGLFGE